MDEPPATANPFPGLRPFEFAENHLFFGRDGQTDELLRRLRQHRFLAVVGTSGSGKSSLVRAGLLPDIHGGFMVEAGSGWRVAICKPGNDPIGNLASALSEADCLGEADAPAVKGIIGTTLRRSTRGLVEVVRQARIGENLLVIADQFEELFRFRKTATAEHPEDEAAALVKLLLEASAQREVPIYVVLTMRSDYLGDCARFGRLPEAINEGLYLIPRMTRDQRREAIAGPVAVGGGTIAPRLVNRLLNDMGDEPDQLPILQHALMRMWDCWRAEGSAGPLDFAHYERVGTMAGALCQQADEAYAELAEDARLLAEKIFKRLTEKGADNREVRRPCTLQELIGLTGGTAAEVQAVVEAFRQPGRSFLMPSADKPLAPESLIDISHESLIRGWALLSRWVDEEAAAAEIYRRLAQTAQLHQEGKAGLWRDPDLQLALTWRTRNQPTATWARRYHPGFEGAAKFLDQSQASRDAEVAEQQRQRQVRRRLRDAIIAVLAVACVVSWIFFSKALRAQKKAEAAEAMAVEQQRAARSGALRVRKQNMDDKSTIVSMAGRLAELATPEEAAIWQGEGASALSQLRKHEEAIRAYESLLETDPQNVQARFGLGYYYIVVGQPAKALAHTDAALQRNPAIWAGYQNRGVALGALGRFEEAAAAIRKSMEMFRHSTGDFSDSEIAPEIQQATGRTMIVIDSYPLRTTSLLELANLEALNGSEGFEQRLQEAIAVPQPIETYLVAVNWVWYHFKARPQDYGGFAAQGAWWERAGFRPWAKQAYGDFQSRHQKGGDARYTKLAVWVSGRIKALKDEKLPEERLDPQTLAIDAWDHEKRNAMDEAQRCLDQMIKMEPDNVGSVLLRALFSARRAWACVDGGESAAAAKYFQAAKSDCDAVLKADPRAAIAYTYRALAKQALHAPQAEIEDDFRKAIANDPADGEAMQNLSDLIAKERPEDALALIQQSLTTNLGYAALPYTHWRIAKIHLAQRRFPEALSSIETAIAINGSLDFFYDLRAQAERGCKLPENEVAQHLAAGYLKVADARVRAGAKAEAIDLCWKTVELLAQSRGAKNMPAADRQIAAPMARISTVIERTGSKAKAIEFWKIALASGQHPDLRGQFEGEVRRLSAAP